MLSDAELERYSRQLLLPGFDIAGQEALGRARVLIVGLGGLGSPAALYLAAAGVGELVLADGDTVELSNLQRQIAHREADVGRGKAQSASDAALRLNSSVRVQALHAHLNEPALVDACERVDLAIDATDNYPTRFALNRACIAARIPLVSAAAVRTEGQVATFNPAAGGGCYRCLFPREGEESALRCSDSGVLGPVVGIVGSLLALEAIKLLTAMPESLAGALLTLDLRDYRVQRLALQSRPGCPDCGGEQVAGKSATLRAEKRDDRESH
ncbi:MAG: HesA/MoeB/ThiF family protein [Chromatocurvus sp.]